VESEPDATEYFLSSSTEGGLKGRSLELNWNSAGGTGPSSDIESWSSLTDAFARFIEGTESEALLLDRLFLDSLDFLLDLLSRLGGENGSGASSLG